MKFRIITNSLIGRYFSKGHERSIRAKKNILYSFFIKGISIAISLVVVPLTLNYINPSRYGIWLTISSIVGWLGFFDIGLTQGLRNKFAEAKAKGDHNTAQIYVSTTYALLGIIFTAVWILFIIVNQFLDWTKILNVDATLRHEVNLLAVIVFTYFCLNFVLRIVPTLIIANQEPAKATLIDVLGQILSLALIIILVKTTQGSLVLLGLVLCLSPLVVVFGANFYYFKKEFHLYRPVLAKVRFSYAKGLFNLGIVFFIIQIASIIQFQTANIIIARNFGTSEVTAFNIVYKYFSVLLMVSTIFLAPFWSASTEAYIKRDITWIRNGMRKYTHLNLILLIAGIIMLAFSNPIYRLWLGKGTIEIGYQLSFWGFLYFNIIIFGGKYVNFLNGINALRLQFIASLISPFLYIFIAFILVRYFHFGVYSLFVASIVANVNAYALAPLQYHQIINKDKKGFWIR
jgi:O-antigen/teichoic acid export membrane protein